MVFSSGFPYIIPKEILKKKKIFINSHPALLPRYKGRKSIPQAFKNNEIKYGCTLHYITEKVDGGPIIYQDYFLIKNKSINKIYQIVFGFLEPYVIFKGLEIVIKKFK